MINCYQDDYGFLSDPRYFSVTPEEYRKLTSNGTDVDLSGYYTSGQTDALLAEKADKSELSLKQDKISDLNEIRNGASLGSTAIQEEVDPTVPAWAKQASKPSYTAEEVGALSSATTIPSKTSDLTNDSGFITGYTETDPTVPAWAKETSKPTYTAQEVGAQEIIEDLDIIRSGATLGLTSVQKDIITYPSSNKEIWYVTTNKSVMYPSTLSSLPQIVSNTYDVLENKGTIVFSEDVTSIGDNAFKNCLLLSEIYLPESIITIGGSAFELCGNLYKIAMANNVTNIGAKAFDSCFSLEQPILSDSIASFGIGSFYNNKSLKKIVLPNALSSIPYDCFSSCENLETVVLQNNVTSINEFAFNGCGKLHTVKLNEGLETLGRNVFERCSSINSINLPSTLLNIMDAVFISCTNLQYISFSGTIDRWNNISKVNNWHEGVPATVVHCVDGDVNI